MGTAYGATAISHTPLSTISLLLIAAQVTGTQERATASAVRVDIRNEADGGKQISVNGDLLTNDGGGVPLQLIFKYVRLIDFQNFLTVLRHNILSNWIGVINCHNMTKLNTTCRNVVEKVKKLILFGATTIVVTTFNSSKDTFPEIYSSRFDRPVLLLSNMSDCVIGLLGLMYNSFVYIQISPLNDNPLILPSAPTIPEAPTYTPSTTCVVEPLDRSILCGTTHRSISASIGDGGHRSYSALPPHLNSFATAFIHVTDCQIAYICVSIFLILYFFRTHIFLRKSFIGDSCRKRIFDLPIHVAGDVADADLCPICLDAFDDDMLIKTLRCNHHFHITCVDFWLLKFNPICPLCKAPV